MAGLDDLIEAAGWVVGETDPPPQPAPATPLVGLESLPAPGARWRLSPDGRWDRWSWLGQRWERASAPMPPPPGAEPGLAPHEWVQHPDGRWEDAGVVAEPSPVDEAPAALAPLPALPEVEPEMVAGFWPDPDEGDEWVVGAEANGVDVDADGDAWPPAFGDEDWTTAIFDRIDAAADAVGQPETVDAMPEAWSVDAALDEIMANGGSQPDPDATGEPVGGEALAATAVGPEASDAWPGTPAADVMVHPEAEPEWAAEPVAADIADEPEPIAAAAPAMGDGPAVPDDGPAGEAAEMLPAEAIDVWTATVADGMVGDDEPLSEPTSKVADEMVADEMVADEMVADEMVADERGSEPAAVADRMVADEPAVPEVTARVADEMVADEPAVPEPTATVADDMVADDTPVFEPAVTALDGEVADNDEAVSEPGVTASDGPLDAVPTAADEMPADDAGVAGETLADDQPVFEPAVLDGETAAEDAGMSEPTVAAADEPQVAVPTATVVDDSVAAGPWAETSVEEAAPYDWTAEEFGDASDAGHNPWEADAFGDGPAQTAADDAVAAFWDPVSERDDAAVEPPPDTVPHEWAAEVFTADAPPPPPPPPLEPPPPPPPPVEEWVAPPPPPESAARRRTGLAVDFMPDRTVVTAAAPVATTKKTKKENDRPGAVATLLTPVLMTYLIYGLVVALAAGVRAARHTWEISWLFKGAKMVPSFNAQVALVLLGAGVFIGLVIMVLRRSTPEPPSGRRVRP